MTNLTDSEKEAVRKEASRLLEWAILEIRSICGHPPHATEATLTTGEQAWIWAIAEFAHNIPHLFGDEFFNCLPFSKLDELRQLKKLYTDHYEEIAGRHADGWTKERIYSVLFPQSFTNRSLCEDGQSTGNDDA